MKNLDSVFKSRGHHLADKGADCQSYGFSNSHVKIWELDHKKGWVPKNWCFRIVVLEKTFESPLDSKEVKSVNPKGNQPWTFNGRTNAEVWPDVLDSLKKILMLGKIEGKRRRGQQRMRWLDSITNSMDMNLSKLQEIVRDREAWCATIHGIAESDMTKQLNRTTTFPGCLFPSSRLFLTPLLASPIPTSNWRLERFHSSDSKDALETTYFPPRGRQQPWLWLRAVYCPGALSALLSGGSSTVVSRVCSSKLSVHTGRACQNTDSWVPPAELFS